MNYEELLAQWNTDEGKPYKGSLIDWDAYEEEPGNPGCMCAQGQVLHYLAGWDAGCLNEAEQWQADMDVAKLLNISTSHSILLRQVNDTTDGAPAVVLTNPEKVLGDKAEKLLDFWWYLDSADWDDAGAAAGAAAWDDAGAAARAAAGAAARAAAWAAARDAARAAAGASNEIQGFDILKQQGKELFFLPMFGFSDLDQIPPRPDNYGTMETVK